jgi:hypothetical protein
MLHHRPPENIIDFQQGFMVHRAYRSSNRRKNHQQALEYRHSLLIPEFNYRMHSRSFITTAVPRRIDASNRGAHVTKVTNYVTAYHA